VFLLAVSAVGLLAVPGLRRVLMVRTPAEGAEQPEQPRLPEPAAQR
jgi:hypothetical protein